MTHKQEWENDEQNLADRWSSVSAKHKMGTKIKAFDHFAYYLIVFCITLSAITNCSPTTKKGKSSWIKFCRGYHKKLVHTQECTKGIEFSNELHLNCLCVKGVWAIFSGSCDTGESFSIINGKGNCFQMNSKVTRFINLGSTNDFPSVYFIGKTRSSSHSTYITETMNPDKIDKFIKYAFAKKIPNNSPSDFFETLVCEKRLANHEQTSLGSIQIYVLPNATMITSRFHNLVCDSRFRELVPIELKIGNVFRPADEKLVPFRPCSLECHGHQHTTAHPHAIGKRSINKSPWTIIINKTEEELTKEALVNSKQNEATSIILRQNNAFLLFGVKENLNVSQNWIVVQKANKILKTACPNLDPIIQNSMVRMFRFLYAYFKDGGHASREYLQSELRLNRVKDVLEKCSKDAKKIEFKYGPPGVCEKDKKIVEVTIIGQTKTVEANETMLSEKEAYSRELHDVLIESIWKMISFVHYFCSEYFAETPFDHAALTQMFTGFLGEDIVYRWHNPEVANKGLYSAFNAKNMLDHYAQGLDICVASAKKITNFPTWIDRPDMTVVAAISKSRKKRVKRDSLPAHQMNKCLKSSDIDGGLEVCTSKLN